LESGDYDGSGGCNPEVRQEVENGKSYLHFFENQCSFIKNSSEIQSADRGIFRGKIPVSCFTRSEHVTTQNLAVPEFVSGCVNLLMQNTNEEPGGMILIILVVLHLHETF